MAANENIKNENKNILKRHDLKQSSYTGHGSTIMIGTCFYNVRSS